MGAPKRPMMPPSLQNVSVSGRALVEFVVDAEGNVRQARVVEASPPEFADAGRMYFEGAKFTPGRKNGQAVATRLRMPFTFHQNFTDPAAYQPVLSAIPESEILPVDALDVKPRVKSQQRPQYPPDLRRNGISGEAIIEFIVDTQGRVQGAQPVRATQKDFGLEAARAVSKWTFRPGMKDGRAVNTRMQLPITFKTD